MKVEYIQLTYYVILLFGTLAGSMYAMYAGKKLPDVIKNSPMLTRLAVSYRSLLVSAFREAQQEQTDELKRAIQEANNPGVPPPLRIVPRVKQ